MRQALPGHLQGVRPVLNVRRHPPVDYGKCCQTVTIYRQEGPGQYSRRVCHRAFLELRRGKELSKTGSAGENSFLLVIPGEEIPVRPGDKVLLGEGPEVLSREDWAAFIPAKVPGLVVVGYVEPKYWRGKLCHTEAGG